MCIGLMAVVAVLLGCTDSTDRIEATSVVGDVTLPPLDGAANARPGTERLFDEVPLDRGVTYAVDPEFSDALTLEFTAPAEDISTYTEPGFFGVYNDAERFDVIVEVFDLSSTLVFDDHVLDLDAEFTDDMFSPVPDDVLAWFVTRPGVEASPIVRSMVLGSSASTTTYSIGPVDGAEPCLPGNEGGCLAWFTVGTIIVVWPSGYSGALYSTTVGGIDLLVNVRDRINARAAIDGLRIATR